MIWRRMLDLMDDESPTYERIRYVCTAPQEDGLPWLALPRTFELEDPTTYFNTDIKVRHENMLTRSNWAMAFKAVGPPQGSRKAGDDEEDPPQNTPKFPRSGGIKLLGAPLRKTELGAQS